MSNDLISEYTISDMQVLQMDHSSNSLDLPVSEMHMKMVDSVSTHAESQHFYVSTGQQGLLEPISTDPGFNTLMIPNNGMGHNESSGSSMGSSSIWMSDQPHLGLEDVTMISSLGGGKTSYPVKRKAEMGPLSDNSMSQQSPVANKRPAHMGADANSGFLQPSAPQRKTVPTQSKLGSPVMPSQSSLNKKMVRNDSGGKSGLQRGQTQMPKRKTSQIESASKVRPESSEGVRSKMRESLAAALALASQKQDNVSNSEKKQSESESTIPHQPIQPPATGSNSTVDGQASDSGAVFHSRELGKSNDSTVFPVELPLNGSNGDGGQTFQQFQYSLPEDDASFGDTFFVKDDLLQGNGLSWAFDFDVRMGEAKEAQNAEKPDSVKEEAQGNREDVPILTPENAAFKIEAELFKLFGGVNKKYREKGRSLLFNLKDRNNPELRERVMSGEISPERLCSMSAEELASKELSEWRMAKAEEMAQMVVLPDTDVDIRRLVRKTHKGEFQVEVEHGDDIAAAEVSAGTSVFTKRQPKERQPKEGETSSPSNTSKEKVKENNSEGHDSSGNLIIPTDGTDLMQGMMVEELKDAEFLPPIVSLDEFMESLNTEPPFENLSADAAQKASESHGESPKPASSSRASNRASGSGKDAFSRKGAAAKRHEVDVRKSSDTATKQKDLPSVEPKVEYIWDGILQLSISSSITVGGLFQSGEKTSTKEWPSSLEIKGRVRLDAFEKFLQELPNSRTRAVMALQFVLKNKSSEDERTNLHEAIESYKADDRLGYAEPAAGAELYLCPPSPRIFDILNKYMPKERHASDDNSSENGLIGVVVWRRNILSPTSSSSHHHHKHSSKKQSFSPPGKVQDSTLHSNTPPKTAQTQQQQQEEEDDDDVPPGFGPGAAKDDDDLPEFNFSGGLNPNPPRIPPPHSLPVKMPQRPVDQVRELIKKYGQSGSSSSNTSLVDNRSFGGIEPWNDDDDDDIPEWRPQAAPPLHPQPHAVVHSHRPLPVNSIPTNQHVPTMPTRPPGSGLAHPPPGGRWPRPPAPPHGGRWRHH